MKTHSGNPTVAHQEGNRAAQWLGEGTSALECWAKSVAKAFGGLAQKMPQNY